jgi:hypothetical protein
MWRIFFQFTGMSSDNCEDREHRGRLRHSEEHSVVKKEENIKERLKGRVALIKER